MELFSLFAKIALDSSEYEKGLSSASSLTQSFGDRAKAALGAVGKAAAVGLTAASAGVVAFGKSAVDSGTQFDKSMAQVAATMGKTVGEIGNLRDFAMEMGAKTAFSATQAADALNYMALAGYDAETSINMLPNVLNLAAAGTMELAAASDMITDSQSALGLSLDQTSALVDQMAAASSKANTSVSQLGSAILTVGGTAKTLKGGTVELSTSLGLLANSGVKGAEGGTALRNIILSLTAPTDKAAKKIKSLGVNVLDSSGNMRSMKDIFTDFNKALSGMSEGRKTEVLSEIFNKVDLKSVNALMAANVKEWDELSGAIENSKYAAEKMAKTQLDNLAGDITLWRSALEGAQIMVSDMLTPSLREFVQIGTSGLTAVTDAFNNVKAAHGLVDSIREAGDFSRETFLQMRQDMEALSEGTAEAQLAAAQSAGFDTWDAYKRNFEDYAATVKSGVTEIYSQFQELAAVMASGISLEQFNTEIYSVGDTVDQLYAYLKDKPSEFQEYFSETVLGLSDGWNEFCDIAAQGADTLDWKLKDVFDSVYAELSAQDSIAKSLLSEDEYAELHSLIDGTEADVLGLYEAVGSVDPSLIQSPFAAAMEALPALIDNGIGMVMEGIPKVFEVGGQILGAVVDGIITNLPVLAEGAAQVASTFADYLKGEVETALDSIGILEPVTESFSGVGEAFDRIGESVSPLVEKFTAWATSAETAQGATNLLEGGLVLLGDALSVAAGFISDIVDVGARLATTITENSALFAGLAGAAGSFMAAIEINTLIGFATQMGGLTGLLGSMHSAVSTATLGLKGMFAVLAANPIIAVVTVIGFLVTAFITAYNTSEDFRNKVNGALQAVKNFIDKFVAAVDNFFTVTIPNAFNATIAKAGELKDIIVNFFTVTIPNAVQTAVDWFQQLPSKIRDVGARLLEGLWNGISDKVEWLKGKVSGVVDTIKGWFTGSSGFDEHSPSHWAERVGEYVSIGLANGIEKEASEAEKAAEKMAKNVYNGLSKWADRITKYDALSLSDQLEMWREVQSKFAEGTDQWWSARDKVFDLEAKVASEQSQKIKDIYSGLVKDVEYAVKRYGISTAEQLDQYERIRDQFWRGSEEWLAADEKVFDLRQKLADEEKKLLQDRESAWEGYASKLKGVTETINGLESDYQKELSKRAGDIANSYKLFAEVPEAETVSAKDLFKNLRAQVDSIGSFYDNIRKLSERGVGSALVEEIRAMGVSASGELEALLSLSDKKLAQYAELYGEKQSLANSIAVDELSALRTETDDKIKESLESVAGLYDEYAPTIGASFAEGLAQGIRDGMQGALDAAAELADKLKAKFDDFAVNSFPSLPRASGEYGYYAAQQATVYAPAVTPALSAAPYSSGYQEPIQIEVKAEPAPLIIDGREFARVIYQYFVEETNRQGRQLIVT